MAASYKALVTTVRVFGMLLRVAMVALNAAFLYYMEQLEHNGCRCAQNWRRSFAEASLALFVILGLADIFGFSMSNAWLSMMSALLFVAYVVITRQFIHLVQHTHCSCAQSTTFNVLNVVNYIQIAVLCFVLLEVVIRVGSLQFSEPPRISARNSRASTKK